MDDERIAVEAPRSDESREWELFVRESGDDPLVHAGSVTGPSLDIAREQAEQLFGWTAAAFWLCPADEVHRFSAPELTLGDAAAESETESELKGESGSESEHRTEPSEP